MIPVYDKDVRVSLCQGVEEKMVKSCNVLKIDEVIVSDFKVFYLLGVSLVLRNSNIENSAILKVKSGKPSQ